MKFLSSLLYNFVGALTKYTVVSGRAGRKEFWLFALAAIIIGILLSVLTASPILRKPIGIAAALFGLAIFIPCITTGVRRLHDTNKTGWLMLLCLIPLAGGIAVLVLCAMKGTPGRNQYGSVPADY